MPNVLIDRHHAGLFHSLQLLGKRLGWTIYTPTGMEWWAEEYWSFGRWGLGDDRLARQYMNLSGPDGEFPDDPIAYVTLAEAKAMDWAYVMATVQENQPGLARFARETGAAYLLQVGNTGQYIDWDLDPLALVSSEMPIRGRGLVYHQEMDPIAYVPPSDPHTAASFVNAMPEMGRCWSLLEQARAELPIAVHGNSGCPDGIVRPFSKLVETAQSVGWGWHDKAQGDGFGHVIHTWAAVGRPLIGHASHYQGRMAEPFWRDMETCIDLDRHSVEETVEIIRSISVSDHARMCETMRGLFEATVDYDAEAEQIRDFLRVPVTA